MEYTISKVTKLTGVTARTLRYYDEIGILKAHRSKENGYRSYGEVELLALQSILICRELGFSLEEIKNCLDGHQNGEDLLLMNLCILRERKERLELLMENIQKTIDNMHDEDTMDAEERFQAYGTEH